MNYQIYNINENFCKCTAEAVLLPLYSTSFTRKCIKINDNNYHHLLWMPIFMSKHQFFMQSIENSLKLKIKHIKNYPNIPLELYLKLLVYEYIMWQKYNKPKTKKIFSYYYFFMDFHEQLNITPNTCKIIKTMIFDLNPFINYYFSLLNFKECKKLSDNLIILPYIRIPEYQPIIDWINTLSKSQIDEYFYNTHQFINILNKLKES